jgi:hypothetical protein
MRNAFTLLRCGPLPPAEWAVCISLLMSLSLVLAACALQRAQQAHDAKRQLVGMTDEKILACMGPPRGHSTLGSTDVWQYNSGNGHVQTGAVATANSGIVQRGVVGLITLRQSSHRLSRRQVAQGLYQNLPEHATVWPAHLSLR